MAKKWPETVLEQLFKSNIHFRSVFRFFTMIDKVGYVNSLNKKLHFLHRCLTLDERRIDARKVCNSSCVKAKSADWKPSSSIMARDPGKLFFRNVVARILSNIVVKVSFKLI